jgi:hypothetical protein
MNKLVCSICGFASEQKKFKWSDINEGFNKAIKRYLLDYITYKKEVNFNGTTKIK